MRRDDAIRLLHMLDAAREAVEFAPRPPITARRRSGRKDRRGPEEEHPEIAAARLGLGSQSFSWSSTCHSPAEALYIGHGTLTTG